MTEVKKRTITLTDRAPVKIVEDEWPVLASGTYEWYDSEHKFQANRTRDIAIRVRQHADGRALVYAVYDYSSAHQNEADALHKTGVLLAPGADLIIAIKEVGSQLIERAGHDAEIRDCVNECIADLPAQEI